MTGPTTATGGGGPASPRATVRRKRDRADYDRGTIDAILDEGLVCHVGFTDGGATFVQPTAYVRVGDALYLHGARANRMLRRVAEGADVCVTVTLLDGIVLARSAFHHSVNYRSVMVLGTGAEVTDPAGKRDAVVALLDALVPGRTADARPPTDEELRATTVVRIPTDEASAKVRLGGPVDDAGDLDRPVWAGVIPLTTVASPPLTDIDVPDDIDVPAYASGYAANRPGVSG